MKSQIIVGFDAKRVVRNGTGLGSYGRTLVADLALFDELKLNLYAPDAGREDLRMQVPEWRNNVEMCYPVKGGNSIYKAYWRSRGIVKQLQRDGVQVFHGLSGELPVGMKKSGIKSVVTIHDLIFMRHPEYYNPIDVFIYKRKFFQTLREADRIVAISECTRRDICELGGVPEDKIDLVYQSCATRFSSEVSASDMERVGKKYDLPRRYVLSVGSIEERKNALLALKSLHGLPEGICLVLVGRPTDYSKKLQKVALQENLVHRLMLLHGVPDEDLPAIYAQAEVFVYPSRYEGFGIPIIEAIRMHLPVVACTGSCLEEAGGPDNLYVGPDDAAGMAHAVSKLLKGNADREERIARSCEYIRRFENTGAAARFVEIYRSLAI
jgi:glycosyltransferase involved in cell wall biosynthesis